MTGRAEFGDFLREAHWQLGPAAAAGRTAAARGNVEEVIRSLLRVVTVMGRYVQDITTAVNDGPACTRPALQPWPRACIQAREALASSAGFLIEHGRGRRWPAAPAASPLARHLDAVTVSLTTGRDLLQTHFAPGVGGARRHRSEWAHVVTSQPVSRALLAEIGSLARQVACQGADLALSPTPGEPEGAEDRRRLNAACQWQRAEELLEQRVRDVGEAG